MCVTYVHDIRDFVSHDGGEVQNINVLIISHEDS